MRSADARNSCWIATVRILNEFLDTREDLEVIRPEFGTVMFPRVRHGTSERFVELLREKYETSVVPGRFFEMPCALPDRDYRGYGCVGSGLGATWERR